LPLVSLSVVTLACSSTTGAASDGGGAEALGPVSFKTDLIPKFVSACGLASICHQDEVTDPKTQKVFMGCMMAATNSCPFATAADAAPTVYMGIVNKTSQEEATMAYIKPSDPDNSYLLHKIDGTQGTLMCVPVSMDPIVANAGGGRPPCGQPMPDGSPMAEPILRDLVRRWIAEGAQNN
jgi:hypothetical protein